MLLPFIMLLVIFVWAGCLIAISFMESWLKFRASGVTVPVGLSIGKLVFSALNKMELVFASFLFLVYFIYKPQTEELSIVFFCVVAFLLLVQTFWLLPALDARAGLFISGKTLAPSKLHWYFITAEVVKLFLLLILAYLLFKGFMLHHYVA